MDKIQLLNEQRGTLIGRMEDVIGSDNFNEGDQRKVDELKEEVSLIDAQLEVLNRKERREMRELLRGTGVDLSNGEVFINAKTGQPVKVIRNRARFADEVKIDSDVSPREREEVNFANLFTAYAGFTKPTPAIKNQLTKSVDAQGGLTVPEWIAADVIDKVRARNRIIQSGAGMIDLQGDTRIVRIKNDPTVIWHVEDAEETPDSMGDFLDSVDLKPKTMYCLIRGSRELIQDSVNVGQAVEMGLVGAFNDALYSNFFYGTNSNGQGKGLTLYTDINEVEHDSHIVNYDPIIKAVRLLKDNNVNPTSAILSPRDWEVLSTLKNQQDDYLQPPAAIDFPLYDSSKVKIDGGVGNNESDIFLADWRDFLIGVRLQFTIEQLREYFANRFGYGWLASWRLDFVPLRSKSFSIVSGIVPEPVG